MHMDLPASPKEFLSLRLCFYFDATESSSITAILWLPIWGSFDFHSTLCLEVGIWTRIYPSHYDITFNIKSFFSFKEQLWRTRMFTISILASLIFYSLKGKHSMLLSSLQSVIATCN